jgi:heat-inducible transcriptional repressor
MTELSARKREILRRVVEEYVATGQPVGSKALVQGAGLPVSASTVRHEFAELESLGLLTHPHTSAGRIPTEGGYRLYAEELVEHLESAPARLGLDLVTMRTELETALQATTETLSQATRLLALVSAPSLGAATVRHVEVLLLQPRVLMVVVISSAGGVTKQVVELDEPIDPGLAMWAHEYLNEQTVGLALGTSMLRRRLAGEGLLRSEQTFLAHVRPVFDELEPDARTALYVGGAAGLLGETWAEDELDACRGLLELLEHRAAALELLSDVLDPHRTVVRVGSELGGEQLHDVSYVGASYGLVNRPLGTVGLLGPLRMDYEKAILAVRAAAFELSRVVGEVYEES